MQRFLLACSLLAVPALMFTIENESVTRNVGTDRGCQSRVLGWIPGWDQERAFQSFERNVKSFDDVALFWYFLDQSGHVRKYKTAVEDKRIIEFAQQNGVKVFALVANLTDDDGVEKWDRERVRRVLASEAARGKHVGDLVGLATSKGFDGINIDYESLADEDRELFSTFINELAAALHAEGKQLAVAIHPKATDGPDAPANGSRAQDWAALYPVVDQMHFMTYGEHTSGDERGPIASLRWIEKIVRYATVDAGVPATKIWLGVPLYAESFREASQNDSEAEDLTYTDVLNLAKRQDIEPVRDATAGASFIIDGRGDDKRTIWFENAWSVERKLELAEKYGICNVAFWRLGGEDDGVWNVVRQQRQR